MRITNPSSGRLTYYDRTPLTVTQDYTTQGLAPAVLTTRWTYTVPANRKAQITALNHSTSRVTAGAPVGRVQAFLNYAKFGGGGGNTLGQQWTDNTIGAFHAGEIGMGAIMLSGDAMSGQTSDGSTGGTVDFSVSGTFTEFDA